MGLASVQTSIGLVILLVDAVSQGLLVHPGIVEALVVFLQEVAVSVVGGLDLEPELLELVVIVIGEEALIVPEIEPASVLLEGRRAGTEIPALPEPGGPLVTIAYPCAEHVGAEVLQAPDVEITLVALGERSGALRIATVRVAQVPEEVLAEPADLTAQRREFLGPALR